jgi:hypothetical protein
MTVRHNLDYWNFLGTAYIFNAAPVGAEEHVALLFTGRNSQPDHTEKAASSGCGQLSAGSTSW